MKIISVEDKGFDYIAKLLKKPSFDSVELNPRIREANKKLLGEDLSATELVHKIVTDVRNKGDEALCYYSLLFDGIKLTPADFRVTEKEIAKARESISEEYFSSLKKAADNIRRYHEEQKPKSWLTYRDRGAILGQSVTPLERVGIYVPGGTAAYPSSVLMNAIPAKVAGVSEIVMAVPVKDKELNPYVLVAAYLAGVDTILKIGGAQAIAAMAFGTETINKVDKITGPGNIFVTLAKKEVYGHVDIDMLAGPSEILIIADSSANPIYTAADMLSQAEHDYLASSILLTDDANLAEAIANEVEIQLGKLPRENIARTAIENNGHIIVTKDIEEAIKLANISAPEHLELLTSKPFEQLPLIHNAGAVFLGHYSPEPLGDYFAGPNHVLPTGGTARYYSVLNVETFMKRSSIIAYTQDALMNASQDIINLATIEGLEAHANAIRVRSN